MSHKHVCFVARGQEFAAPITAVLETTPLRPLSRVFHVEPFIAGVMSLRGEIVAVVDLGLLLGLGPTELATGVVIVRSAHRRAGLLADRLSDVRELLPDSIGPVPQLIPDQQAPFFRGIASLPHGPIAVLDIDRIFQDERVRRYERRA